MQPGILTPPQEPSRNSRPRPIARRRTNDAWTSRRDRPPIGLPSDTVFRLSMTAARTPSPTSRWGAFQFRSPYPHKRSQPPPSTHPNTRQRFDSRHTVYTVWKRWASVRGDALSSFQGRIQRGWLKKMPRKDESRWGVSWIEGEKHWGKLLSGWRVLPVIGIDD